MCMWLVSFSEQAALSLAPIFNCLELVGGDGLASVQQCKKTATKFLNQHDQCLFDNRVRIT